MQSKSRVILYSHDTMGLGHMRRNLLIAQTLANGSTRSSVLLVCGVHEANAFPTPAGVDYLTLPALRKETDGQYDSRSLDVNLSELIALRAGTIRAATEAFEPDLFVVDNVPRGAAHELEPTLKLLRRRHRTAIVLGLRDVLDDPSAITREWRRAHNFEAIRNWYDAVWVYGDVLVCDHAREYHFTSTVASKLRYTGYFDQRARLNFCDERAMPTGTELDRLRDPFALCVVGGGQDGAALARAFALARAPGNALRAVLTGPFMPAEDRDWLMAAAERDPSLVVLGFMQEPGWLLKRAACVVAMGGYNSTCEVLSFTKPALIVPRVSPRCEQLIRAERLHQLGYVDILHPDGLTAEALSGWLSRNFGRALRTSGRIDLNGLDRLPHIVEDVLADTQAANGRRVAINGSGIRV